MLPQAGYGGGYGGYKDDVRGFGKKRNPVARALARHGGVLSLILMLALATGGVAFSRHASACRAAAAKAHAQITELQNEHGRVKTTHHVSSQLADAKSREVATLQAALDEVRRQLAHEKETVAARDRRVAELEHASHGHGATAAELDVLRSRVDTLTRSLADKTREADDARRALETEKELHLKKEAEWRASGGHGGGADDDDHAGFLQVATLLDEQGVKHPAGTKAMAVALAKFFERQMADVMAAAERGDKVADTPAHDISSKLIQTLTEAGVTSSHGLDHFFQTIDHLTDAALTHWAPSPPGDHHAQQQQQHHHHDAAHHQPHGAAHAQPDAAHHAPPHEPEQHARHKPDASGFVI